MNSNFPTISVVTITYNQEKYIVKCLESVLSQNYNGKIEFIISNDGSTDKTHTIISNYLKQTETLDNFKIIYINNEKNIGPKPNFLQALNKASGDYIAICEGDDYWIDNSKLTKQINTLQNNKDCIMCFHRVKFLKNSEEQLLSIHESKNEVKKLTLEDISKMNIISTASVLFKNGIVPYDEGLSNGNICDYPLWLSLATKGNLIYIPDIAAVYRVGVGIQSSLSKEKIYLTTNNLLEYLSQLYIDKQNVYTNLQQQIANNHKRLKELTVRKNRIVNYAYKLKDTATYYMNKFIWRKK